jgi:hypothetical protein
MTMSEDLEVPRRGYDTKDVEAMAKEQEAARPRGSRKVLVIVLLALAIAVATWFIALR